MLRLVPMIDAEFEELPPPVPADALAAWTRVETSLEAPDDTLLAPTSKNVTLTRNDPNTLDLGTLLGNDGSHRTSLPPHRDPLAPSRYQRRARNWGRNNRRRSDQPKELAVRYAARCAETGDLIEVGSTALWYPDTRRLYCPRSETYRAWNSNRAVMGFIEEGLGENRDFLGSEP